VFLLRMWELYKRFVKHVSWAQILTPKRFVLFCDWWIRLHRSWFASPNLKDSDSWIWFVTWIPKIQPVFMNPTNPHESWWILSTIAWNESLRIQAGGLANLDLQIQTLKICIADSIRRTFFKRLLLWIQYIDLFSKDLYCGFDS
jgi:hypothetical protein